jgi:hypothetical protein
VFTKQFLTDAAERAIATFAQAVLAVLSADGLSILTVQWDQVLSVGALALVLSVLKSIVATRTGDSQSASLVGSELER